MTSSVEQLRFIVEKSIPFVANSGVEVEVLKRGHTLSCAT
jgi:hypothetical protein